MEIKRRAVTYRFRGRGQVHLGPKRRRLLGHSWAGVFRDYLRKHFPVKELASGFRDGIGAERRQGAMDQRVRPVVTAPGNFHLNPSTSRQLLKRAQVTLRERIAISFSSFFPVGLHKDDSVAFLTHSF